MSPWETFGGHKRLLLSKAIGFVPCLFIVAAPSIVRIGTVLNLVLYACAGNAALGLRGLPGCEGKGKESIPSFCGDGFSSSAASTVWGRFGGQGWHRWGRGYYLPSCTSLFITCPLFLTFCIFHCEKWGGKGGSSRCISGSSAALLFPPRQAAAGARGCQDVHICS